MKDLGNAIRSLREELYKGTQDKFAMEMGIAASGLSRYERGQQQIPIAKLQKIADILDITVTEIVMRAENIKEEPKERAWRLMGKRISPILRDELLRLEGDQGGESTKQVNGS